MATDSETVDGVLMDDDNASYDRAAKRFLSMKALLAWILKYLVAEFRDCSIRRYEIKEKILHGHGREDVKNYDLMVAIMVYLGNTATKHRLLRLLHLIFLDKLKAAEKKAVLKRDYDLVLTPVMEEDLTKMGSLALGIAERAKDEGIREGCRKGRREGENGVMEAIRMLKKNLPPDAIVKKTGMTLQSLTELKAML